MTLTRVVSAILALLICCSFAVGQVPASKHVYILAEENTSYEHLISSPNMPYLNSLIQQNGLATQFYSNQHSSLPNYFWVTSGQPITEDNETTLTFDVDNIVRRVMQLGLTYKSYAQALPYPGYAGVYSGDTYLKRHAPLPYYSDMGNSPTEMLKHVPIDQLTADIQSGNLPNFAFITPDSAHDLHDCDGTTPACEQVADQFLQQYIQPLLARPEFQPGGDGLLIVWADEADLYTDNRCSATVTDGCGGRVLVALIGPKVKKGFQSTTTWHHENVLRTMLEALGTTGTFPGAANNAQDMAEFFNAPAPAQQLTISAPTSSNVDTQMHVVASAQASAGVDAMQVYVDDALTYSNNSAAIDSIQQLSAGTHYIVIKAWDKNGSPFSKAMTVTATPSVTASVNIISPGNISASPVRVTANGQSSKGVAAMQIYADDQLVSTVNSSTIDQWLNLPTGLHNLVVKMWDNNGTPTSKSAAVTISATTGITLLSPAAGNSGSQVHVLATANSGSSSNPIGAMRVYVDSVSKYTVNSNVLDTTLSLSSGSHYIVIVSWDNTGKATTKAISVNVQ